MSDYPYAAKIENSIVIQVIVGTAEWANSRLDGFWVDSEGLIGVGWTWDADNGFQPPEVVESDG